jgi:hypothetical protein
MKWPWTKRALNEAREPQRGQEAQSDLRFVKKRQNDIEQKLRGIREQMGLDVGRTERER